MQRLWLCLLRGWVAGWRQSVLLHGRSLPKLTADWGNWIWRNTRFTATSLEPLGKVHPPSELFPPLPPTHSLLFKQVWLEFPVTQKIPEPEPPERWQVSGGMWERMTRKEYEGDPWCPVVKISPSSAWGVCSIPGQGAKIPHAPRPPKKRKKKRNVKWKQYCNKFNEDFKNGPHQNTNLKKKKKGVWDKMTRWWQPPAPRDFGTHSRWSRGHLIRSETFQHHITSPTNVLFQQCNPLHSSHFSLTY